MRTFRNGTRLALLVWLVATRVECQTFPVAHEYTLAVSAQVDSALRAGLDTATVERGWCIEGHVVPQAHVVYADLAFDPISVQSADSVNIAMTCTMGAASAHTHLMRPGYPSGPSLTDGLALGHWELTVKDGRATPQLRKEHPFGIIVERDTTGQVRYLLYGVP